MHCFLSYESEPCLLLSPQFAMNFRRPKRAAKMDLLPSRLKARAASSGRSPSGMFIWKMGGNCWLS